MWPTRDSGGSRSGCEDEHVFFFERTLSGKGSSTPGNMFCFVLLIMRGAPLTNPDLPAEKGGALACDSHSLQS